MNKKKLIELYKEESANVFGEIPIAGGEVRNKGDLNSPVVGVLTFTYNEHVNKGTFMITLPSTMQTCILGYGVNWEFFDDLKRIILEEPENQILDESNESKQ